MPNVDVARQKKVKKACLNKDVKFKKIFCSKKTKNNNTKEEDHTDDECHEEEEKENETEKEREEREETECEETELEEQEREKKDDEENDDNEDTKEKTLDDIKALLLSLCVTDEERHLVKNLNYDQAKSLLKILQKNL
jgi:hypothetical protein